VLVVVLVLDWERVAKTLTFLSQGDGRNGIKLPSE
jgi:hypothetical protein